MNYETLRDILAARPKSFALLGFLAVLNVAIFVFLAAWQRPQLEHAQTAWLAERAARSSRQSPAVVTRYDQNDRDLELFRKRLIPKQQFASFLSRLLETAQSNKLGIKSITYKPASVKGQPSLLSYQLGFTVSGGYPSIKHFIGDLSRFPDLVTLDELMLDNRSKTSESVNLKVQLTAFLKMEGA